MIGYRMKMAYVLVMAVACGVVAAASAQQRDAKVRKVTIKHLKYEPAKLTIKAGETVVWTNEDDNDHTVVSDEEDQFESENIGRGETFKHTFKSKGKFAYHCRYHPRMKGVITVSD